MLETPLPQRKAFWEHLLSWSTACWEEAGVGVGSGGRQVGEATVNAVKMTPVNS